MSFFRNKECFGAFFFDKHVVTFKYELFRQLPVGFHVTQTNLQYYDTFRYGVKNKECTHYYWAENTVFTMQNQGKFI